MQKGISHEIKERVESLEGLDLLDAAKFRYQTELRSFRWLSQHWCVNARTVRRILESLCIPIRHGSAAVRTQWVGNAERRAKAGERLAQTNHALAKKGLHVRQGKRKENSALLRSVSEKLKASSSFLRPAVKAKALRRSLSTRRLHPERMSALRLPLSKIEAKVRSHLMAKGLDFEERKLIGQYVVDFFIPTLNLIIDCQGRNRFPLSFLRHACISHQGASVFYCVNDQVERGNFSRLDDYISRLEVFRCDPSLWCAETVIWGACGRRPFGDDTDKFIIHTFGVRTDYFSELTASPDD
ncbi:DUF559 domain-containing protein [Alloprevotella tannerae]|uniref:DUF559 domain-containing protein n=1 Tax=Alloprevotella tannerae TaxID=76122 RepID=UPI0036F417DE